MRNNDFNAYEGSYSPFDLSPAAMASARQDERRFQQRLKDMEVAAKKQRQDAIDGKSHNRW